MISSRQKIGLHDMSLPTSEPADAPSPPVGADDAISSPSWSDMGPELIAKLSIFADIGDELMYLCVVAGPLTSRIIRKTFLQDNEDYLRYCLALPDTKKVVRKQNIYYWMESNPNWKGFCRAGISDNDSKTYGVCAVRVPPEVANSIRFTTTLGGSVGFNGFSEYVQTESMENSVLRRGNTLIQIEVVGENDTITTDVVGKALEDVESMLLGMDEDSEAILFFGTQPIDTVFNNIRCATRNGLDQILRYHAEKKGLNLVNYIVPRGLGDQDVPPLWISLPSSPDKSVTEYLLSLGPVDMGCMLDSGELSVTIVHFAACRDDVGLDVFAALCKHSSVDVNARDTGDNTALLFSVNGINLEQDEQNNAIIVKKIKILLEAGANPHLADERGLTPIDLVRRRLSVAGNENAVFYQELLTLLENHA